MSQFSENSPPLALGTVYVTQVPVLKLLTPNVMCWETGPLGGCCDCSLDKSCPPLYNPIDCSTQAPPVLHYLLELPQIHVH